MPISVGDILFTSLMGDDEGGFTGSFSIVATTNIAAGETITFHQPEGTDGFFTFTIGANGLGTGEFLTFGISAGNAVTVIQDPTGAGSGASAIGGSGVFQLTSGSDEVIASDGTNALAAITNSSFWDANIGVTGLNTTAINAAIAAPTDPIPVVELKDPPDANGGSLSADDNSIWIGGAFSTIDNVTAWRVTRITTDHDNPNIAGTTFATQAAATPCFAPGTLIATDAGEVAVETLAIGDMVKTATGELVAVKWIGRHTAVKTFARQRMEPVRFAAGSLGDTLPHTDLIVTPDHGMILDGLVINASALVNGGTIDFVPMDELEDSFTVYHVETEAHDVILANGAPAETFVDAVSRSHFDNHQEYLDLYGVERVIPEMPLPRISSARLVPLAVKDRLGLASMDVQLSA